MDEYWKKNAFLWSELPDKIKWSGKWTDYKKITSISGVEYLIVWRHKTTGGDLENIEFPKGLKFVELNWSNCRNISLLPKSVKRLEAHYCTKLETVRGLASQAEQLDFLHFNRCKKFVDFLSLTRLKLLRVLRLNSCADIPDLSFLSAFPELEDFRFVNTKVVNGDLTPILKHPKIKSIGSLDKKHYSHKIKEIEELLEQKR
jgi:hypothetical protein